jgi:hypothetical protein
MEMPFVELLLHVLGPRSRRIFRGGVDAVNYMNLHDKAIIKRDSRRSDERRRLIDGDGDLRWMKRVERLCRPA